jgi:hypothetical protein
MHGKAWTLEEDEILRNLYPHEDTKVVIEILGRGVSSIKHRARKLGVTKTKEAYDKARAETYKQEGLDVNSQSIENVPINKAYMNKNWLVQKYFVEELSSDDIGKMSGVEGSTVLTWMKHYGLKRRAVEEITDNTRAKISIHASKRRGPQVGRWNGGQTIRHGYKLRLEPSHPNANASGYVQEHRLVTEFVLARLLKREEVVHHRDSNRLNNVNSNLFVFPNASSHAKFHQYKRYKNPNISEEEFMVILSQNQTI